MAGSSSVVEIRKEYPCPSHISTPSLSVKLSDRVNYNVWKTQMVYFLTSHDMLGFINGTFLSPKRKGEAIMEAWTRSDALVVSWILGTLSEEVTTYVVYRLTYKKTNVNFTAKDVWDALERIYGPKIIQQATGVTELIPEDGKSKDKSKEEETNEEEREKTLMKEAAYQDLCESTVRKQTGGLSLFQCKNLGMMPNGEVSVMAKTEAYKMICECIAQRSLSGMNNLLNSEEASVTVRDKPEACKKLYECILRRSISGVNNLLDSGEVSVTDIISTNGNTALHVAVGTSMDPVFIKKLLEKTPESVSLMDLKNVDGSTLLHIAATVGNIKAAKILMENYSDMLYKTDKEGQTPLIVALSKMHKQFYWSLLDIIGANELIDDNALFSGTSGDELLVLAISSEDYYLARNLIWWRCKNLHSDAVLMALAQNYPCELSFWERRAAVMPFVKRRLQKRHDAANLLARVCKLILRRVQKRHEAFQVLKSVCKLIQLSISSSRHKDYYTNPVLEATRQDALEVVKVLVYHFPDAFWGASEDGHNVIQYAVINRSEKIYNLLNEMSEHKNVYKTCKDSYGNNLLHLAARLAPSGKLNLISGAALQIQYELQWYKEVESFGCPLNMTEMNSFEETPRMVFTRTHKALVSDGEKWMKSTAESYTITAALITTIVFAAAITVPGGNTQDTGVPIFINNPAFTIFAVSDAISLFTAVMSLLMFLSILTARFAEEDFLEKLPRKLIIGLFTLFISTTTMIIAFGAALFIVFGQNNGSLLIPIGALTGLTITFFVALQFPLVVDLMRATYGRSIINRRNDTFRSYIHKMIWQPIVEGKKKERERIAEDKKEVSEIIVDDQKEVIEIIVDDKKEERENLMQIDWEITDGYYSVHSTDDIPFNI